MNAYSTLPQGGGAAARPDYNGPVGRVVLWLLAGAALFGSSPADYLSAKRKIDFIGNDRAQPGARILFTSAELNAYVSREIVAYVPEGLRNPKLELGHGSAWGSADVNFPKLRQAAGKPLNWFLTKLLEGERPVRVNARIQSGKGVARVDVERVEISGVAIHGAALDFLIRNFLLPYYPEAKVGQPFELKHGIERLEVRPAAVRVVIGKR